MTTRITQLREAAGLTKIELARRAGINERTVRNLERGIYEPSLKTARGIADALGVPLHHLLEHDRT